MTDTGLDIKATEVTQVTTKATAKYLAGDVVAFEVKFGGAGKWLLIDHLTDTTYESKNEAGITLDHWLRVVRAHIRTAHHITVKGHEN